MFESASRYEGTLPFSEADSREPVFRGFRPRQIHPAIGVLEHSLREGDRPDLLALGFYNDPRRWWRILDANPDILYAGDLLLDQDEESESSNAGGVIIIPRGEEEM